MMEIARFFLLMLIFGLAASAEVVVKNSPPQTRLFVIAHYTYNSGNEPSPNNNAPGGYGYYIAPISDPELIAKAREVTSVWKEGGIEALIDWGGGHNIIADIAFTADGINRDYSKPGAPLWNWHVTEVKCVCQSVLVGMNGTPWLVENGLAGGFGKIGFWSYIPIGELPFPFEPDQTGPMRSSWIGDFSDEAYPWVYHEGLGWLWVNGFDPENVWLWWHDRQDWLWTSESIFPWVYDRADTTWKWYLQVENGADWFYNTQTGEWEQDFSGR